ncbi:MAG: hypothetical protein WD065_02770 [Planctomycetaceae bacterium]
MNLVDFNDPILVGVFNSGIDALANINAVHDIIPSGVVGQTVDQPMGVGFNVSEFSIGHDEFQGYERMESQ